MNPTRLTRQLAARIVDYIRDERARPGTRFVERTLAEHLRVSRSPVRAALRLLEEEGVLTTAERGGYAVLRTGEQLDELAREHAPEDGEEAIYLRIAADRRSLPRDRAIARCREHVELADLLLALAALISPVDGPVPVAHSPPQSLRAFVRAKRRR